MHPTRNRVAVMPNYEKQWSSATPGLLIILMDQSGSMLKPYEGTSRTKFASLAVNRVIDNIIQKNADGDSPKNRCFISVIGYNHNVRELCSGWLKDLDENPKRYDTMKKKTLDGTGGLVEVEVKQPIWVEPITEDGATNMLGAFQTAKEIIEKWMADRPDSPAPVIINISDGVPYYDGKDPKICMRETVQKVSEIKRIANADGEVLVFNAQIDKNNGTLVFPSDRQSIRQDEAQFLFDISSVVPESYKDAAMKNELPTSNECRGCIFGADGIQLIQMIDFGSSKGQGDK